MLMFRDWKTFITWEKSTKDTIDVKTSYIDVAGGVMEGILLSQIVYWYLPSHNGNSKLRIKKNGHFWIKKTKEEWYEEIRFSRKNYDTAIKKLEKQNLVVKEIFKYDSTPSSHIRLNIPIFLAKLNEIMNENKSNISEELEDFDLYLLNQIEYKTSNDAEKTETDFSKRPNGTFPKDRNGLFQEKTEWDFSLTENKETTTETITKNTYLSEIENSNLSKSIKNVVKDLVDRLVSDDIKLYEIENHLEANKELVTKAEYARILKWCLGNTTDRIRDFSALMDVNITNHLKMKSSKAKEAQKAKINNNPIRKEIVPSFFGINKEKDVSTIEQENENLDDIQEMIKNLRIKDKQE